MAIWRTFFVAIFIFKLKHNLDDEPDEEIDGTDDLFNSQKRKLDEEEDTASTIVAITADIISVISRTKKRGPRQPNPIRNKVVG